MADVSVDGGEVEHQMLVGSTGKFYCGDTSTGRRCEHQMLDTGDRGVTLVSHVFLQGSPGLLQGSLGSTWKYKTFNVEEHFILG